MAVEHGADREIVVRPAPARRVGRLLSDRRRYYLIAAMRARAGTLELRDQQCRWHVFPVGPEGVTALVLARESRIIRNRVDRVARLLLVDARGRTLCEYPGDRWPRSELRELAVIAGLTLFSEDYGLVRAREGYQGTYTRVPGAPRLRFLFASPLPLVLGLALFAALLFAAGTIAAQVHGLLRFLSLLIMLPFALALPAFGFWVLDQRAGPKRPVPID